jgi:hypothetical protein
MEMAGHNLLDEPADESAKHRIKNPDPLENFFLN